jgi:Holliday junction resolvase RusA-like endonuclease
MTPRRTAAAAEPREIRPRTASKGNHPKAPPITWQTASCRATPTGWLFTLPVPERTNAIWRSWKGRTLVSAKHRQDKQAAPAKFGRCQPLDGEVAVSITWYRARRAGDVDGRIKAALDLLRGIAYDDDRQVAELRIVRRDDPNEPARLDVLVEPCPTAARAA